MGEYPYVLNTGRLKQFFKHIQNSAVPPKVTTRYLESIGFKSKNDRKIIPLLKYIGFLDASQTPTELWKKYRDKTNAPKVLAQAILSSYKNLFDIYPDAYRKDDEALRNFFAAETNLGEQTIYRTVLTFKTLCELADFREISGTELLESQKIEKDTKVITKERISKEQTLTSSGLTININIQLQLPATENEEIYNKLFQALKRHLLSQ